MASKMSVEKAAQIAGEIAAAHKKWGKHGKVNYKESDLYEAIGVLHESGNIGAPSAEDVTKLRRQLAACQNREKARKAGTVVDEGDVT